MPNNKKAFTLAEMMISFAIIATIASLMMVRFKNVSPKETIVNYKKAYVTVQQAVAQLISDANSFPTGNFDQIAKIESGEIVINDDGLVTETVNSNEFCKKLVRALNTIGTPQCSSKGLNMTLSNGIELHDIAGQSFDGADADNYIKKHIDIIVDTNGKKAPNTTEPHEKRDRFRIRIYVDGKVTTSNEWAAENAIFEAGTTAATKKICFKSLKDKKEN